MRCCKWKGIITEPRRQPNPINLPFSTHYIRSPNKMQQAINYPHVIRLALEHYLSSSLLSSYLCVVANTSFIYLPGAAVATNISFCCFQSMAKSHTSMHIYTYISSSFIGFDWHLRAFTLSFSLSVIIIILALMMLLQQQQQNTLSLDGSGATVADRHVYCHHHADVCKFVKQGDLLIVNLNLLYPWRCSINDKPIKPAYCCKMVNSDGYFWLSWLWFGSAFTVSNSSYFWINLKLNHSNESTQSIENKKLIINFFLKRYAANVNKANAQWECILCSSNPANKMFILMSNCKSYLQWNENIIVCKD